MPWEVAFTAALRAQCLIWGGSGNLVMPFQSGFEDHPVYRAIVRALDPDTLAIYTCNQADLEDLAPKRVAEWNASMKAQLRQQGFDDEVITSTLERWAKDPLAEVELDGKVQAKLLRDHPFLHYAEHLTEARFSGDVEPGAPFVESAALRREPDEMVIREVRSSVSLAAQLALAAEVGQLAPAAQRRLAARGFSTISPEQLDEPWGIAGFVYEVRRDPSVRFPFALAERGLGWFSRGRRYTRTVPLIVGDDPWDFSLFYAARRLGSVAFWLPAQHADDAAWNQHLRQVPRRIAGSGASFVVASVSDPQLASRVASQISRDGSAPGAAVIEWEKIIPERPSALLVSSLVAPQQTVSVSDGLTGHLVSPVPPQRTHEDPFGMHWMVDVHVDGWSAVMNAHLATRFIGDLAGGESQSRVTRGGVAYSCVAGGPNTSASAPES